MALMELRDRIKRETDWQEKAFRIAGRHRDALADALGTPPDIDNVPDSLWRQIEDDWAALLVLMLLGTAIANASQHGRDISVGPDNATATDWARDLGRSRGADFATNTRKALEVKAREWSDRAKRGELVSRDELRNTLDDWLAQRGRRLIETEFTTASVWGGEFGTALAGVTSDDDLWKTNPHLSASGPCPVCAPLNGRRRPEWSGEFPSGPPAHPQCVLPQTRVGFRAGFSTAYRADYCGPVIEIRTRSGRVLSVTENHPVLTATGFVPAGLLTQGQYAVCGIFGQPVSSGASPHAYQRPASAEQVFEAARESGCVSTSRVPAAAEQFDGDGLRMHGNVDVVRADRGLRTAFQPSRPQPLQHREFGRNAWLSSRQIVSAGVQFRYRNGSTASGGVSRCCLCGAVTGTHVAPDQLGDFATVPPNADPDQVSLETTGAGKSKFGRQGSVGFASDVSVDNRLWNGLVASDAASPQVRKERDFLDAAERGEIASRFPSEVTVDQIVEVKRRHYVGPVYDFEVPHLRMFSANGLIVHNCVCEVLYARLGQVP